MNNKLIAHVLLKLDSGYIFIKRSAVKRGKANVFPEFWDIPGGTVEPGEFPADAAVRECYEEVGIKIRIDRILFENSERDVNKDTVFTRLVYIGEPIYKQNTIRLDREEHSDYYIESNLLNVINSTKKFVPYLKDVIEAIEYH